MAHCPFCRSSIDEELARFGGHCPKCVIEIPGDETPTDPGIGKRVEEQVETERQRRWGVFIAVGALAAVVLLGAGSVLWWRLDQQHQADLAAQLAAESETEFYILPAEEHQLPTLEVASEVVPREVGSAHHSSRGPITNVPGSTTGGGSGSKRFDFTGSSDADQPELAQLHERSIEVAPQADLGSVGLSVPQIEIARTGVSGMALSDPEEIRKSVGTALKAYSKQMNTCYERRLKNTPDLAGTWDVSFTITQSGRTSNIGVVPQTAQDSLLEACMAQAIAGWSFQPMVQPQNFAKAYTFGTQ